MASKLSAVCELVKENAVSTAQTPITLTASTAVYIPAVGRTMVIGVTPSGNTPTLKIYKGNGVSAMNDVTLSLTKDKIAFVQIDTNSFEFIGDPERNWGKDADGDIAYIKLECSTAGTLVAVNAL